MQADWTSNLPEGVSFLNSRAAEIAAGYPDVFTPAALAFVAQIQRAFNTRRLELLQARAARQARLDAGENPGFLAETAALRQADWQVAPCPPDLQKRRVEITGPTDAKMVINALNSGASVFMADFEDANAPTWQNMLEGQRNLSAAIAGALSYTSPEGKAYHLNPQPAVLMARPRGWHLEESHLCVDGAAVSGSLFDFGLYFFHNARRLLQQGSGPYFYLPKLESHLEARLWNDVFNLAQDSLSIPRGSIRATVLIETILAAFEMEEILYELRQHAAGLNAGRWDYIFSILKKFRNRPECLLPDRIQITMTTPFMRAYTELLVQTCHKRGAHAMGGMAAYIPSRRDPVVNEIALDKVRQDKQREANDGFDGTWVAHPDLAPVAMAVFDAALGQRPHQKERLRPEVQVAPADLLRFEVPGGQISAAGLRLNINVGVQYIASWLRGVGAAAIHNLMEDAATAEISRAQVWQWIRHPGATLADGRKVDAELVRALLAEELAGLRAQTDEAGFTAARIGRAAQIFETLVTAAEFQEFLTLAAYPDLVTP